MEALKRFTGESEQEIWQQVTADMQQEKDFLAYNAVLNQNGQEVLMDIDIDLGGGFESGLSTTLFQAITPTPVILRFSLQEQDLFNEVGKIFGMEDIKLGYPEFDAAFIVQANQPEKMKHLFADEEIRNTLLQHPNAELKLAEADDASYTYLQFTKDDAIVELADLQAVYRLMHHMLRQVD